MRCLLFVAMAAVVACGPSAAELKTAKTTTYNGNASEMFDIIEDAVAENYKIGDAKRASEGGVEYALITLPQWYNPEGGRESAGDGDYVQIIDHSIRLSLLVQLVSTEPSGFVVTVTPKTFQHISGSPQPRELQPDDPNLPGFVQGRVDSLYLEIHKRLQKYASQ